MDISMCLEIRLNYLLTYEENRNKWDKTGNYLQDGREIKQPREGK